MSESEQTTRQTRIDTRLRALGWAITPFRPGIDVARLRQDVVTEFETRNGPADYVVIVDGRIIGIIEAKRFGVDPENVLSQAERYARGLGPTGFEVNGLRAPLLWRSFSIDEVKARDFKLDGFKWLKDESLDDGDDFPEPEKLATDGMGELEAAMEELQMVLNLLDESQALDPEAKEVMA